ncbi:MAG: hypothetical protein JNL58_26655 [Planctomyces sp.]|nr:hypothetical protein [Planctomyces sp.]
MKLRFLLIWCSLTAIISTSVHGQDAREIDHEILNGLSDLIQAEKITDSVLGEWLTKSGYWKYTGTKLPDNLKGEYLLPVKVQDEKFTRGGTFLQLDFETSAAAIPFVFMSENPIWAVQHESGVWGISDTAEMLEVSPAGQVHSVLFEHLKPDTDYFVVILMVFPPGSQNREYSALTLLETTKARRVKVDWTLLYVMDDSDDLSAGELDFYIQLGHPSADFYNPGNTLDFDTLTDLSLSSGQLFEPGVTLVAHKAPETVKFAISGYDDDTWGTASAFDLDEYSIGGPDVYVDTSSSSDGGEWNSGNWLFNVAGHSHMSEGLTPAERERFSFSRIRTVWESYSSTLEYRITLLFSVDYE